MSVYWAAGLALMAGAAMGMAYWFGYWRGWGDGADRGYKDGREDAESLLDGRRPAPAAPTFATEEPADPRPGTHPARVSEVRWVVPRVEDDNQG